MCVHYEQSCYSPHIYGRTLSSHLLVSWRLSGPLAITTSRTRFALVRNFSLTFIGISVICILPRDEAKEKYMILCWWDLGRCSQWSKIILAIEVWPIPMLYVPQLGKDRDGGNNASIADYCN